MSERTPVQTMADAAIAGGYNPATAHSIVAIALSALEREGYVVVPKRNLTDWTRADHIRLHAGVMTAQELRSVRAVVNAIIASIHQDGSK